MRSPLRGVPVPHEQQHGATKEMVQPCLIYYMVTSNLHVFGYTCSGGRYVAYLIFFGNRTMLLTLPVVRWVAAHL